MRNLHDINEDTYAGYGFNRQELTDFFHSKDKRVNFGLPPMNFDVPEDIGEKVSLDDALAEIQRLKIRIAELEADSPSCLGKYHDNDPLLLAIQIRNKDWKMYDPDNDRATRGSQVAIIHELEEKGFSNAQAKSIEMVACPIKR